jgi:hypothetical protein
VGEKVVVALDRKVYVCCLDAQENPGCVAIQQANASVVGMVALDPASGRFITFEGTPVGNAQGSVTLESVRLWTIGP